MDQSHDPMEGGADAGLAEAVDARVEPRAAPMSLQAALRRARIENVERSDAMSDLHGAASARLDLLREQLEPVFAQLPAGCDMFDLGMTHGEKPRLFVDMIAFVEPARDRRGFRFLQDTRNGRVLLAETASVEQMTQAVTDYLARRLVEREKALAADASASGAARPAPAATVVSRPTETTEPTTAAAAADRAMRKAAVVSAPPRARPGFLRVMAHVFVFLIEVLGSAAFFGALAAGGYWLWMHYGK